MAHGCFRIIQINISFIVVLLLFKLLISGRIVYVGTREYVRRRALVHPLALRFRRRVVSLVRRVHIDFPSAIIEISIVAAVGLLPALALMLRPDCLAARLLIIETHHLYIF